MKYRVIKCLACGWEHEEVDALSCLPAGAMGAFSDPEGLQAVMLEQSNERLKAALAEHCGEKHPHSMVHRDVL